MGTDDQSPQWVLAAGRVGLQVGVLGLVLGLCPWGAPACWDPSHHEHWTSGTLQTFGVILEGKPVCSWPAERCCLPTWWALSQAEARAQGRSLFSQVDPK